MKKGGNRLQSASEIKIQSKLNDLYDQHHNLERSMKESFDLDEVLSESILNDAERHRKTIDRIASRHADSEGYHARGKNDVELASLRHAHKQLAKIHNAYATIHRANGNHEGAEEHESVANNHEIHAEISTESYGKEIRRKIGHMPPKRPNLETHDEYAVSSSYANEASRDAMKDHPLSSKSMKESFDLSEAKYLSGSALDRARAHGDQADHHNKQADNFLANGNKGAASFHKAAARAHSTAGMAWQKYSPLERKGTDKQPPVGKTRIAHSATQKANSSRPGYNESFDLSDLTLEELEDFMMSESNKYDKKHVEHGLKLYRKAKKEGALNSEAEGMVAYTAQKKFGFSSKEADKFASHIGDRDSALAYASGPRSSLDRENMHGAIKRTLRIKK